MSTESAQFLKNPTIMKHLLARCLALALLCLVGGSLMACNPAQPAPEPAQAGNTLPDYAGKKILFVNSYHPGYEWSDGIEAGLHNVLDGTGVELKVIYLDTKRNPAEAYGQEMGRQAKAEIDAFKPDVVIAADDNAQKYVVIPFLKDTPLPVIFCAVNWDASVYGYPASNVTGMLEVDFPQTMVEHLKGFARGERLGYVTVDSETERKVTGVYNDRFFNGQMKVYFVKTFAEFKEAFLKAQDEVDMVYIGNNAGIDRWDPAEAEEFFTKNTRVPTGTDYEWLALYALISLAKSPQEQGEWSAQAALDVLGGKPIASIPEATNKKNTLIVNLNIAETLDIVFPPSMLKVAEVIDR